MKPRNKYEKGIIALSKTLRPLTTPQRKYAILNAMPHIAKCSSKGVFRCLECNHEWKVKSNDVPEKVVCPHCGMELTLDNSTKRSFLFKDYFITITQRAGVQVVRTFYIESKIRQRQKAEYFISEVFQKWIDPSGRTTLVAKRRCMSYYIDQWVFSDPMEIRKEHNVHTIYSDCVYPKMSLINEIKRNGFKKDFHNINPSRLFKEILSDSRCETLLKSGYTELLRYILQNEKRDLTKYWQSVKVCIRNGYNIEDPSMWWDLLSLLEYFGKDLHNAKYICPADIKAEHDRWYEKKEQKLAQERLQRDRERYFADLKQQKKDENAYKKAKKKFFGIAITDGEIYIRVLKNVKSFYDIGAILHHCVATNKYYNKPKSLILSAEIDNKPVETIEVSLETMQIVQCRGRHNQNTEYHERILNLMRDNMHQITSRISA